MSFPASACSAIIFKPPAASRRRTHPASSATASRGVNPKTALTSFAPIFSRCYNAPAHCIPPVLRWMDRADIAGLNAPRPIALHYGDASEFGMSALMAAGLALFLLTLAVNFTASSIVARSRSGAQSEG